MLGILALSAPVHARWRYYDERGKSHVVDLFSQIPEQYRGQAVDLERRGMGKDQRNLEEARLVEAKPVPVPAPAAEPPKTVNGFQPAFAFRLPRLPTPTELFALDVASRTPHFSWGLLDMYQNVGGGTWNFSTVLLGLVIGGVAFFLIDKFKSAGAPAKAGIVVAAIGLIVANTLIGTYADKLDSAVSLFNTSRNMNGGRVAVASVSTAGPAPERGGVRITGTGNSGASGESGGIAEQPANPGNNPFIQRPTGNAKTDFEEMKRAMQEQMESASHSRDAVLDQVAK